MTQDEILIYDLVIAQLGDSTVTAIDGMTDSDKFKWESCIKVLGYKKIIRLHLAGKTPDEIEVLTGENYKQVNRIITRFNQGKLTA